MSEAGSVKIKCLSKLSEVLNSIAQYRDRVYSGYRPPEAIRVGRYILIHLVEDRYVAATSAENIHLLTFHVLVGYRTDVKADPEEEMSSFIESVGLVEDQLKSSIFVPGYWEDLTVERIHYTFGGERSMVYYSALVTLRMRVQW